MDRGISSFFRRDMEVVCSLGEEVVYFKVDSRTVVGEGEIAVPSSDVIGPDNLGQINGVPVDYPLRFNGPVTALTARCVRHGVVPDFIC